MSDQRQKAVSLTRLMFRLPSYRKTLIYLLASCFIAGVLMKLALGGVSGESAFLFGGAEGILLLAFPAVLASVLATGVVSRKEFRARLKYFLFISFTCALLASVIYLAGVLANSRAGWNFLYELVLIASALTVLVWFVGTFVVLNLGLKALPISFIQAFLNIAFIYLWTRFGLIESTVAVGSPVLAFFKVLVASGILLLALWSIFFIINAPAKRNFGISTVNAVAMFFAQWIGGSKAFESVLEDLGEPAETLVGGVIFKNKRGGVKSVFAVPYVHYGPVGNLGGSEFPQLICNTLDNKLDCTTMVFHGTVNHDFNPVHSYSFHALSDIFEEEASTKAKGESTLSFDFQREGASTVFNLGFGQNAFMSLSRAPKSTEDIDLALGMALRNRALASGWKNALVVDKHNSITTGKIFGTGSRVYFDFESAVSKVVPPKKGNSFSLGVAKRMHVLSVREGIAGAGIRCAVFNAGGKTACMVLIDGNNVLPEFRQRVLLALKEFGFDYADVFSTDSHSVNAIGGVHNPVGLNGNTQKLLFEVVECVKSAIEDKEQCSARMFVRRVPVVVLGSKKQSELTSTINSIVAMLKIIAPAVFIASLALVVASLVFLK